MMKRQPGPSPHHLHSVRRTDDSPSANMQVVGSGLKQVGGWWGLTAAYAVVIAVGAVIPVSVPTPHGVPLDKPIHLCEYLLLAWCLLRAGGASRLPRTQTLLMAFLVASGYGAFLEGVQRFLPYRSAEWGDVVANTVGAGLGVLVFGGSRSSSSENP